MHSALHAQKQGLGILLDLVMAELAPDSIGAVALLPVAVAVFLLKGLDNPCSHKFVVAVGKAALDSVGTPAKFREILA